MAEQLTKLLHLQETAAMAKGTVAELAQSTADAVEEVAEATAAAQETADSKLDASGTAVSAVKLSASRTIDGMPFDGSADIVHYGTCATAAATAAKVVALTGFTLSTGAEVIVKFTYANTASSPTLNVNDTGAIAIKRYGTTAISTYEWNANGVVEFVYDGTNWIMLDGAIASTTYYGRTKLSSSTSSTSTSLAATPAAVKAAYDLAQSAYDAATSGSSDTGTGSEDKADIDLGNISIPALEPYSSSYPRSCLFTLTDLPVSAVWNDVCYGNGVFVAVCSGSQAAYSTDGVTWTAVSMPSDLNWYSVCYGDGFFVAVSNGGGYSAYSPDGITWTSVSMPASSGAYKKVAYGNGRFVAIGDTNIAYSTTHGSSWTSGGTAPSSSMTYLVFGVGKFVALDSGSSSTAYYSEDGVSWSNATLPSSAQWTGITYGGGKFVISTFMPSSSAPYSFDGITWSTISTTGGSVYNKIVYGDGIFFLIGLDGNTGYSPNYGSTWYKYPGDAAPSSSCYWNCVTYGGGTFVVLSGGNSTANNQAAYGHVLPAASRELVRAGFVTRAYVDGEIEGAIRYARSLV